MNNKTKITIKYVSHQSTYQITKLVGQVTVSEGRKVFKVGDHVSAKEAQALTEIKNYEVTSVI